MKLSLLEPARWALDDVHHANDLLTAASQEGRALAARRDALRAMIAATQAKTARRMPGASVTAEQMARARAAISEDTCFEDWLSAHTAAHLRTVPLPEIAAPPHTANPRKTARLAQEQARARPVSTEHRGAQHALQLGWVVVGIVLCLLPFAPPGMAWLLAAFSAGVASVTSALAFVRGRCRAALALAVTGALLAPCLAMAAPAIRGTLAGWLS